MANVNIGKGSLFGSPATMTLYKNYPTGGSEQILITAYVQPAFTGTSLQHQFNTSPEPDQDGDIVAARLTGEFFIWTIRFRVSQSSQANALLAGSLGQMGSYAVIADAPQVQAGSLTDVYNYTGVDPSPPWWYMDGSLDETEGEIMTGTMTLHRYPGITTKISVA